MFNTHGARLLLPLMLLTTAFRQTQLLRDCPEGHRL